MVPVALVVYTASWAGWLASDRGYHRQLGADDALYSVDWIPAGVRALAAYHQQAYGFHTTLTTEHLYQSNPALWLLQARPTSFYYESDPTCGSDSCSQAITALGNPLLWWIGAAALIVVVYNAVVWADRRAWAIVAGYAGGYLPWLFYAQRTIFTFYTVAFLPFVALALAYAAGRLIGPAAPSVWPDLDWETRRRRRIRLVLLSAGAVVVISAFFFPIWSGQSVPYRFWDMHMWYPSWV
jgi:dolichyl-phosphate-mannose--protein O-mannosyl transferase